jgi:putative ABC transport system permease protein
LLSRVPFTVEGRTVERERVPLAQFRTVSPGYFEAARIPLTRGRTFSERDTERTAPVAVVNEELARHWLDGLEPVGARLLVDDNDGPPRPVEIIGVVGNVRQGAWMVSHRICIYPSTNPLDGWRRGREHVLDRGRRRPDESWQQPGQRGAPVDPGRAQIKPLDRYLSDTVAPRRFSLSLMAAFALTALALAITGIYAVVMYSVSQRAREISIRVALGASRANIVRLVMGHGIRFILIGLVAGIAMAAGATHLIAAMFFGVAATDAATIAQVVVFVAAVSVIACAVPTARAERLIASVLKAE